MDKLYISGDLVMTKTKTNNFIPNGVVCKFVDYVAIDKVLIRTINGIDEFIVGKGQIVPIPLTPSILEKNGWEKLYKKFFEKYVNDIRLTIEFSEYIYVAINRIFIMKIHSIHELQHFLFGLGLNSEMEV